MKNNVSNLPVTEEWKPNYAVEKWRKRSDTHFDMPMKNQYLA